MKLKKILIGFAVAALFVIPVQASEINELYDEIKFTNTCETELDGITLNEGAPDGSNYYSYTGDGEFTSLGGLESNTTEEYMWELDVRFDTDGAGYSIKGGKYGTCVRRHSGKLAIQKGSTSFTDYIDIDAESWYHIQLIASYGTSDTANMIVYKWVDGQMEHIVTYEGVNKRNNEACRYIVLNSGTSVDNVKLTRLGADEMRISTVPEKITEINAGGSAVLQVSASRQGKSISVPDYEWKIYNGESEITDGSIRISSDGTLTIASECVDTNATIKAVSTEKGNLEGEYSITVKSVDLSSEKYDVISLSADDDTVSATNPLPLLVSATKNGETVELTEEDVFWRVYDVNNQVKVENRYIYVENNTLYVTDNVIEQEIILRAENETGTVSASMAVEIKKDLPDILLFADACESIPTGFTPQSGSWDGSNYYSVDVTTDMGVVDIKAGEDLIISADLKFGTEKSGICVRNSGNGKIGGQLQYQSGKIGRVAASDTYTAFADATMDDWYHIEMLIRCGGDSPYGNVYIYKYDAEGNLVHPDDGRVGVAAEGVLALRTMAEQTFHHIQVESGTEIDNLYIIKPVPDEIKINMSTDILFAGNSTQCSVSVFRQGIEMQNYLANKIKWEVYDAENKYPIEGTDITVSNTGLVYVEPTAAAQTVYIRATSIDGSAYDSKPITVKESDIFTVTGIGVEDLNSETKHITELKIQKDFFYNDKVVFVIAVYDKNGKLVNVKSKNMYGDSLTIGENIVPVNIELSSEFSYLKVMTWTSF